MALNAAIVWEVRTTGSDNNGGGFRSGVGGTDRSQQDAAHASGTNLTVDAATNTDVAPDGHTPGAADVGNVIQITAGAGFTTGFYEIASIQAGKWRLDRSPAAAGTSGGTWALGGALATPGKAAGAKVAGNDVWVKAGTYNVSAAVVESTGGLAGNASAWQGYNATRGDTGTRPTIRATAAITDVFRVTAAYVTLNNVILDGNNQTGVRGLQVNAGGDAGFVGAWLSFRNCLNNGAFTGLDNLLINCEATDCTGVGIDVGQGTLVFGCLAARVAGPGFQMAGFSRAEFCVSHANTSGTGNGFTTGAGAVNVTHANCVAYGNNGNGFTVSTTNTVVRYANCIAYGNGATGFTNSPSAANVGTFSMTHCAAGGNLTNRDYTPGALDIAFVTLTADPFVNAAGGNFSLNATAGGGAACRAAGFPGAFVGGGTTGYLDIGASQHPDAGGAPQHVVVGSGHSYLE